VAMTVVMMKLPVHLHEHSSVLEQLELHHKKYEEGCYDRWY